MAIISIGFSKPRGCKPLATLIRLVEGTKFSHTFVTWKDESIERRKIFEAVGSGIRIIGNSIFKSKNKIVELYEFDISDELLVDIEQYSHDMSGRPYGTIQLLGLGYMRLVNGMLKLTRSKKRMASPFRDGPASQICVEAGLYILMQMKGLQFSEKEIESMGLQEYHAVISKHGRKLSQERVDAINAAKR